VVIPGNKDARETGFMKRRGKGGNVVVGLNDQGNPTGLCIGKDTFNRKEKGKW